MLSPWRTQLAHHNWARGWRTAPVDGFARQQWHLATKSRSPPSPTAEIRASCSGQRGLGAGERPVARTRNGRCEQQRRGCNTRLAKKAACVPAEFIPLPHTSFASRYLFPQTTSRRGARTPYTLLCLQSSPNSPWGGCPRSGSRPAGLGASLRGQCPPAIAARIKRNRVLHKHPRRQIKDPSRIERSSKIKGPPRLTAKRKKNPWDSEMGMSSRLLCWSSLRVTTAERAACLAAWRPGGCSLTDFALPQAPPMRPPIARFGSH